MRYKMKGDVLFLPIPNGVIFKNNRNQLFIQGNQQTYELIDRLVPFLDGGHDLDALLAPFPVSVQKAIRTILENLCEAGLVKHMEADNSHELSTDEQALYASHLAFVDHFSNHSHSIFFKYRQLKVLVIGSGMALVQLMRASLESGLTKIDYAHFQTDEPELDHQITEIKSYFQARDTNQFVQKIDTLSFTPEDLCSTLRTYDAVLFLSKHASIEELTLLNRVCRAEGKTLLQGIQAEGVFIAGPRVSPQTKHCWECFLLQMEINFPEVPPQNEFVTTTSILANTLVHELFRSLLNEGLPHTLAYRLNDFTLQMEATAIMKHPACSTCGTGKVELPTG